MVSVKQLQQLAGYYRDLLSAISQQAGKHLVDLKTTLKYGLTTDLGLFINDFQYVLENEELTIEIERVSPEFVSEAVARSNMEQEDEENNEDGSEEKEEIEKRTASSRLIAIYRKQEQDRFNRETTVGFPVVAGKYGNKKFCAPLFYFTVQVIYDPLESKVTLVKNFDKPVFNFTLIAKLVNTDEEAEIVRQKILPLIHEEEFTWQTIEKAIQMSGELVDAFKGLKRDTDKHTDLEKPLEAREKNGAKVFNTLSIVNASRSNAFLVDELSQLCNLKDVDGKSVIETILSDVPENVSIEDEDPEGASYERPLLFPLQSNMAQKRAARKAEQASLMVIHGPPGTGKSQTIANLICDLVSQGKTVMMASHQNKALEVVEQKIPQIDYLAMSLLKGEKASVKRLTNQLKYFDTYVSGISLERLKKSFEANKKSIIEKQNEIRRLKARFSELKTLERDRLSYYFKYYEIQDYNQISSEDIIEEGKEKLVSDSLQEWCNLLRKVREHYNKLNALFHEELEKQDDKSLDIVSTLTKLVDIYEALVNIGTGKNINSIKEISEKGKSNYNDSLKFIKGIKDWLSNYGEKYIQECEKLNNQEVNVPSIAESKKILASFNKEIWDNLLYNAKSYNDNVHEILNITSIFNSLPQNPSVADISSIEEAVARLEQVNWVMWYFSPQSIEAKKVIKKQGILNLTYKTRGEILNLLKFWSKYWRTKLKLIEINNTLRELNIPIDKIDNDSSIAEIARQANVTSSYLNILEMSDKVPTAAPESLVNSSIQLLENNLYYGTLPNLKSIFEDGETYIELVIEYQNLELSWDKNLKIASIINSLCISIYELDFSEEQDKLVNYLKELIIIYPEYKKLFELEENQLKTLPKTLSALRSKILTYEEPYWLHELNKAIEAYRLNKFIEHDLLENPDDISEVAESIRKISDQKCEDIIKALGLQRKADLKKASKDNAVKQQVMKLNKILQRKRKTTSLVQLKEGVIFEKLLNVFPCWIMNIEDVARIFPLQAGLFDYLIVDEASQCNQATTLHLAYRAKRMIVVGDEKQMKNPSIRFLSNDNVKMLMGKHGLNNHPKAEFLHGRESLLALSNYSSNCDEFLNEHFRCEPPIIAWSNHNFYDDKLRVLTPIRRKRFKPCMEVHLVKGADDDTEQKQNKIEAEVAINEAIRLITSGEAEGLSIGIMTLYREQANLLQSLLYEKIEDHPEWLKKYELIASTADGFQGDERDIIIYSFRFGPSSSPGTINAIQLVSERINVAFSRAKCKLICYISRPVDEFPKGIIKEFLKLAEREHKNPTDRLGLVNEDKFDSEFEKHVCSDLRQRGVTVYTQVPCSSFYIDMVIIDQEGRCMAVECDGDFHYEEDGDLRAEDYQRQDIIERSGWFVHRIPARRYYSNPEASINRVLDDLMNQPVSEVKVSNDDSSDEEVNMSINYEEEISKSIKKQDNVSDIVTNEDYQAEKQQTALKDEGLQIWIPDEPITIAVENIKEKESKKNKELGKKKNLNDKKRKSIDKSMSNKDCEPIWEPNVWFSLSRWSKLSGHFIKRYNQFCYKVGIYLIEGYTLTPKQEKLAKNLWDDAIENGFDPTSYNI
ncbi:MAG: hypothetical protein K9L17_10300 [Clostridiales bacterium]|nr:hypothetical protein [Clostridiales bacterium]MCF8023072.1 hypothetical protein [Clostridiales bacterium]